MAVPGTRPGVMSGRVAGSLPPGVQVVAPAANAPYTAAGAEVLRRRGIVALPDFVCSCGATLAIRAPRPAVAEEVAASVERRVRTLVSEAMTHEGGPYAGACALAEEYLATWVEPDQLPDGPPLA